MAEHIKRCHIATGFGCPIAAEQEQMKKALEQLSKYFTSGNSVPVDRAVIKAEDFWRITGMKCPNR